MEQPPDMRDYRDPVAPHFSRSGCLETLGWLAAFVVVSAAMLWWFTCVVTNCIMD